MTLGARGALTKRQREQEALTLLKRTGQGNQLFKEVQGGWLVSSPTQDRDPLAQGPVTLQDWAVNEAMAEARIGPSPGEHLKGVPRYSQRQKARAIP